MRRRATHAASPSIDAEVAAAAEAAAAEDGMSFSAWLSEAARRQLLVRDGGQRARTPNGIRTRVSALKGRRPGPLDDGGGEAGRD